MAKKTEVYDDKPKPTDMLPSIEQLRESQRLGGIGRGLPENNTGKLNEAQGHCVEIKD